MELFIKSEEHCLLNHIGTQPMESPAVMTLYKRSAKKRRLYYDTFKGDEDFSTYRETSNPNVYGVSKAIGKEEDVGHVTNRMSNQLRVLVQDWNGEKLSDAKTISGKGRLSNNRINVFQNSYGFAGQIRKA